MRVFAGTRRSALIVGGAAVIFAAAVLTVGVLRNSADASRDRQASAAAIASTRQLNAATIADVHRGVVVPSTFQGSNTYGDGGCSEFELGCWTSSDVPMVAANELQSAIKNAGFTIVRAYCQSDGSFCEVMARVGQAQVNYWVGSFKTGAGGTEPSKTTYIAGRITA